VQEGSSPSRATNAPEAQMDEHPVLTRGAAGSRPVGCTNLPIAQRPEHSAHNRGALIGFTQVRILLGKPPRRVSQWSDASFRMRVAAGSNPATPTTAGIVQRQGPQSSKLMMIGSNPTIRSSILQAPYAEEAEARGCNPRLTQFESGTVLHPIPAIATVKPYFWPRFF
jgi:hypothetical protein